MKKNYLYSGRSWPQNLHSSEESIFKESALSCHNLSMRKILGLYSVSTEEVLWECGAGEIGGWCLIAGQEASVRQASSLIITNLPLPLFASDQVLEEDAMYQRDFDPRLDLFEDQIFRYWFVYGNRDVVRCCSRRKLHLNIACVLYGRCHRRAISATVKVLLWFQPPLPWLFNNFSCNQ